MSLTDFTDKGSDLLRGIGDSATNLISPTIRLGVTGLSQAGKSVFITALVQNLIEGGRLPFLKAIAEERIKAAYLEPQPDDTVPRFPYEDHVAKLNETPPRWPDSTRQISQLRVTLEFESNSLIWSTLGTSKLHIDIIDYPGEWLLDLPLLTMSFAEWSATALANARRAERQKHANPFLEFLAGIDPSGSQDDPLAEQGARLFTGYLRGRREQDHGLAVIGPGRFLMPGDLAGSPALTFFPLDLQPDGPSAKSGSLHAMLERRYNSYRSQIIRPFYRNHFARLDRQIVLVDALAAINSGPAAMRDLRDNLANVLTSFRPGSGSWLSSILSRRIDRIVFAATKADHLHHTSHDRLQEIMREIVQSAYDRALDANAEITTLAIAAVRATREGEIERGGQTYPVVIATPQEGEQIGGKTFDGKTETAIFSGDLPDDVQALFDENSTTSDEARDLQFARLLPTQRDPGKTGPHPHIRLDRALEFLLGDRLA